MSISSPENYFDKIIKFFSKLFAPVFVPIHREGWPFIAIFAVVTLLSGLLSEVLQFLCFILTLWCVYFFRNPPRVTPTEKNLIIAPADGKVEMIIDCIPPEELNMPKSKVTRVSIFMNVFNVHINRMPMAGTIDHMEYTPGKFLNASLSKASKENERQNLTVKTESGKRIGVTQIAGLVARRIVTFAKVNDKVTSGEIFGLIRFGSRVDVYLPAGIKPEVFTGQTMIGGETVIARMKPVRKKAISKPVAKASAKPAAKTVKK